MRRYYVFYCSRSVKLKGLGRLSLYGIPVLLYFTIYKTTNGKSGQKQEKPRPTPAMRQALYAPHRHTPAIYSYS